MKKILIVLAVVFVVVGNTAVYAAGPVPPGPMAPDECPPEGCQGGTYTNILHDNFNVAVDKKEFTIYNDGKTRHYKVSRHNTYYGGYFAYMWDYNDISWWMGDDYLVPGVEEYTMEFSWDDGARPIHSIELRASHSTYFQAFPQSMGIQCYRGGVLRGASEANFNKPLSKGQWMMDSNIGGVTASYNSQGCDKVIFTVYRFHSNWMSRTPRFGGVRINEDLRY